MAKRGLAQADKKTRERVARQGGKASHAGFKNMDEDRQRKIAAEGGQSSRSGRNK